MGSNPESELEPEGGFWSLGVASIEGLWQEEERARARSVSLGLTRGVSRGESLANSRQLGLVLVRCSERCKQFAQGARVSGRPRWFRRGASAGTEVDTSLS